MIATQWIAMKSSDFLARGLSGSETEAELTEMTRADLEMRKSDGWGECGPRDSLDRKVAHGFGTDWTVEDALPLAVARLVKLRDAPAMKKWPRHGIPLEQVEAMTDEDAAATFGPQWRAIVTVIRQAATLTAAQQEQLNQAYYFDSDRDARAAAFTAFQHMEWYAVRRVACDTAERTASDIAYASDSIGRPGGVDTAVSATWALSVADLVGQYVLEQHHIETLLAPWISVMGDPREVALDVEKGA